MSGRATSSADEEALRAAGYLISIGIPVFAARPVLTATGDWDPAGGCGGYRLPRAWQKTEPDVRWLDRSARGFARKAWRPGWALAAVMGLGLDLLDVDPRNGGDVTREQLVAAGLWPVVYAAASTPSGGSHEFVASMDVGSRDDVRAGLDVKGGLMDGTSRGFAFIAPTVKLSKVTGELVPYRWTKLPEIGGRPEQDDTGRHIAELVRGSRARTRKSVGSRQRPVDATRPVRGGRQGACRLPAADDELEELAEALRQATTVRNKRLNQAAFALAVAQRHRKEVVRDELLRAATDAGLGLEEAQRTFDSGWRAGVRARSGGKTAVDAQSSEDRLGRNALRDRVWASALCSDHKLVMLAVLNYMNAEGVGWPTIATLGKTASMSRSRVTELLKGLVTTGWIEKGAAPWVRTAGPKPNSYRPPRLLVEPSIPPHCDRIASRVANLRRGPGGDEGSPVRRGTGRRSEWARDLGVLSSSDRAAHHG